MPDLVAIDLPGGPEFVEALRAAWDDGHAVAPLDQRLGGPARERFLEFSGPPGSSPGVVPSDASCRPGRRR